MDSLDPVLGEYLGSVKALCVLSGDEHVESSFGSSGTGWRIYLTSLVHKGACSLQEKRSIKVGEDCRALKPEPHLTTILMLLSSVI